MRKIILFENGDNALIERKENAPQVVVKIIGQNIAGEFDVTDDEKINASNRKDYNVKRRNGKIELVKQIAPRIVMIGNAYLEKGNQYIGNSYIGNQYIAGNEYINNLNDKEAIK